MFVYLKHLFLNDDDPEEKYIEADVVFSRDDNGIQGEAEVRVLIPKDDKMSIAKIKKAAMEKAREFLSFVVSVDPEKYNQPHPEPVVELTV